MNPLRTTVGTALLLTLTACQTAPESQVERDELLANASSTVEYFLEQDPSLQGFFDDAAAWAVFPNVGKGAYFIGGGYGRGVLYEGGEATGWCDIRLVTAGLQLGGQAFRELVFLDTDETVQRFRDEEVELSAQVSAVALTAGAAAHAEYHEGVAIFTAPRGGLMAEASVGGQQFTFVPMN